MAVPACHLHCARGPSGGRISPWRDLWGRPPRRAAGRFPAGAGAAAEPWAAPRYSPALRPQARPALTDLEAIAGSRRCRETTCPCLLRREAPWAQGRAAGAQRRAPAPAGHRSETPGPGEHQGSAGARGGVGRGSGAGGYSQSPSLCSPQAFGLCLALHGEGLGKRLLSGAVPAPGQGCPAHEEVLGLALCRECPAAGCSEHPVQSVLRPQGSCCLCLGFAVLTARGKQLLLASPCEAFPSFCLPTDVLRLSCSLGLAGAYCHCACDPSAVWSRQSPGCLQPNRAASYSPLLTAASGLLSAPSEWVSPVLHWVWQCFPIGSGQ